MPTEPGSFRFPDGAEIDTRLAAFRRSNLYGMDRQKQRTLSFTGIPFIPTQDQAMTEGTSVEQHSMTRELGGPLGVEHRHPTREGDEVPVRAAAAGTTCANTRRFRLLKLPRSATSMKTS